MSEYPDLPTPAAIFTVVRTGAQALCLTMGPRKAERFLREWARIAASEESIRALFPIRPAAQQAAEVTAQREALAWLRQVLPGMIAAIPPE